MYISFPSITKLRGLSVLLLLVGDLSLNSGPISFGVVNCGSVRNKGPSISDIMSTHSFSLLVMTEIHIRSTNNDSFYTHALLLGINGVIDSVLMASVEELAFLQMKISELS